MKVLNFRHLGIPTDNLEGSVEFYKKCGFDVIETGQDTINGQVLNWVKMKNDQGFCIEVLSGGYFHLAFTVDEVEKSHYYYQAPSGAKIQFGVDPNNVQIEFVELPKNTKQGD